MKEILRIDRTTMVAKIHVCVFVCVCVRVCACVCVYLYMTIQRETLAGF